MTLAGSIKTPDKNREPWVTYILRNPRFFLSQQETISGLLAETFPRFNILRKSLGIFFNDESHPSSREPKRRQ